MLTISIYHHVFNSRLLRCVNMRPYLWNRWNYDNYNQRTYLFCSFWSLPFTIDSLNYTVILWRPQRSQMSDLMWSKRTWVQLSKIEIKFSAWIELHNILLFYCLNLFWLCNNNLFFTEKMLDAKPKYDITLRINCNVYTFYFSTNAFK